MLICVVSVLIYVLIDISPRGPKSPEQSTGRASVLSPRTNVLICVLMDSHGRPVPGRLVCADGQPLMSCVCWQTPTDVLCVLNRQPTWAKITQTVHEKGQRADMCTDGQLLRASVSPRGPKAPEQSTGRVSVLICVLMDSHGRPRADICTDGQPRTSCVCWRTHTDTHGRLVCPDGQPRTATNPTWAKITQTVHEKGQRADMCTDGQLQTSFVC
uniref:Thyroglobulin type-1 domain-containing protein n=1 Tax=Brassica campestris TaxID=3711 RepID=A0A3P5ZF52_BRACM|nr:unnamed protein product [Brassica rapa]